MGPVKTLTFEQGIVAKIFQDETAENPIKEFDCEANVSIWHRHYAFGNHDEFETPEAFERYCQGQNNPAHLAVVPEDEVIRLPVYLYDHSGLTVNTTGFSCPWDSGQVGWAWITKTQAVERWGITETASILDNLRGTVRLLNDYLTGQVYGYVVEDSEGNHLDSCWGFYGDLAVSDGVLYEANIAAEHHVEKARAEMTTRSLAGQDALTKFRATQRPDLAI